MASTSCLAPFLISSSSSSSFSNSLPSFGSLCFSNIYLNSTAPKCKQSFPFPSVNKKVKTSPFSSTKQLVTKASEYKFPDPIPQFADAETEKFKNHLLKKLSKKDIYEESVEEVVGVCTEIFSMFLHSEYGGPGTLVVDPFIDMADVVNERGLPGGSQAARAAINWAHDNVDNDWNEWTGGSTNSN